MAKPKREWTLELSERGALHIYGPGGVRALINDFATREIDTRTMDDSIDENGWQVGTRLSIGGVSTGLTVTTYHVHDLNRPEAKPRKTSSLSLGMCDWSQLSEADAVAFYHVLGHPDYQHDSVALEIARQDRLLTRLNKTSYQTFADGRRTWDVQRLAKGYSRKTVQVGRRVELRWAFDGPCLWGVIKEVHIEAGLDAILDCFPRADYLPDATSFEHAKALTRTKLGIADDDNPILIAYRIDLTEGVPRNV